MTRITENRKHRLLENAQLHLKDWVSSLSPYYTYGVAGKGAQAQLDNESDFLWHHLKKLVQYHIGVTIFYRIFTACFSIFISQQDFNSAQVHHSKLCVRNISSPGPSWRKLQFRSNMQLLKLKKKEASKGSYLSILQNSSPCQTFGFACTEGSGHAQ